MVTETVELVAGKEMDALIAEKVMGWEVTGVLYNSEADDSGLPVMSPERYQGVATRYHEVFMWSPSTRIADAWQVVEKMGCCHIEIVHWGDSDTWQVNIGGTEARRSYTMPQDNWAATTPLAICRAALAAVIH